MKKWIKLFFRKKGADKPIFMAIFVLICLGIVMIGSASIGAVSSKGTSFAIRNMAMQTVYVLFGLFIMMALTKSFRTKFINYRFSMIMYFVGLASMCVCVLWTAKGSHAWIHVGPITIQPAEFMKVAMILILSYMLTETDAAFVVKGRFRTAELKSQFYKDKFIKCVLFPLGLMLVAFFVGAGIQKDLGTSLILASICFICFMSTPRDYYKKYKKLVWIALGVAVVILGFLITAVLQGYQMERINSWLKPLELENIYSSSWQLVNSLIAFADGGIFGLGLGNSIQKYDYIPEAHNDFIGAIIYEELGIFGAIMVLAVFGYLLYRLFFIAQNAPDMFGSLLVSGVFVHIALQVIMNVAVVLNIMPNTGVTLPFISYGGTSILFLMAEMGLALSVARQIKFQEPEFIL